MKNLFRRVSRVSHLRTTKTLKLVTTIKTTVGHTDDIINKSDHTILEGELPSCELCPVHFDLEHTKQNLFNYAMEYLNPTIVVKKLDQFLALSSVQRK